MARITINILVLLIILLGFTFCSNRKPIYTPEGNILIQRYPYFRPPYNTICTVIKDSKVVNNFPTDSTLGYLFWLNDTTFVTSQGIIQNNIVKRRIVLVNLDGSVRNTLIEIIDSFYSPKPSKWRTKPLIYFSNLFPDHSGKNIFYIKNKDSNGVKTMEGHIYNIQSKTDNILPNLFSENTYKQFDESPWAHDGTMIAYYDNKPIGNGQQHFSRHISIM